MLSSNICSRTTAVVQTIHVRQCAWNRPRLKTLSHRRKVYKAGELHSESEPGKIVAKIVIRIRTGLQRRVLEEIRFVIEFTK